MKIVQRDLWLCADCTVYACNGDTSGIDDDARETEVTEGVDALGPHLVSDDCNEKDGQQHCEGEETCDACNQDIHGYANRFAILADDSDPRPDLGVRTYWATTSIGHCELELTRAQFESCSRPGCDASADVEALLPDITDQTAKWSESELRAELSEYGAWDDDALADHTQNIQRMVWILACDLAEEYGRTR